MRLLKNRAEAGKLLAEQLAPSASALRASQAIVLALPRGGVPVGAELARGLGLPLEPLVVRKLGVPHYPEFAMGAIAAGGHCVLDRELQRRLHLSEQAIDDVIAREREELARRERSYRISAPLTALAGRPVILVDDGMATGSTMMAAIIALRSVSVGAITVAVPVLSAEARQKVALLADTIVCLWEPEPFDAVGQWFVDFRQVGDDEAAALLARAQRLPSASGISEPTPSH